MSLFKNRSNKKKTITKIARRSSVKTILFNFEIYQCQIKTCMCFIEVGVLSFCFSAKTYRLSSTYLFGPVSSLPERRRHSQIKACQKRKPEGLFPERLYSLFGFHSFSASPHILFC